MSKKLKKRVGMMATGAVLVATASIVILSGTAEAQEVGAPPAPSEDARQQSLDDQNAAGPTTTMPRPAAPAEVAETHLVVPGDTLWSIAQEHLGQNAAPQQVANEVERIYELNRDQIGDDPNLIFAGQQLFLVPPATQPTTTATTPQAAAAPTTAATPPATTTPEMAATTPPPPATTAEEQPAATARSAVPTAGQPAEDEQEALAPAVDKPAAPLPDLPESKAKLLAATVVNTFTELTSDDKRRLLGLGSFLLSFAAAGLLLWRLSKELHRGTKKTESTLRATLQAERTRLLEDLKRKQYLKRKRERTQQANAVERAGR